MRLTDVADTEQVLRLTQKVVSSLNAKRLGQIQIEAEDDDE